MKCLKLNCIYLVERMLTCGSVSVILHNKENRYFEKIIKFLSVILPLLHFPIWMQLKVPMADKPGNTVNFRKLLLNRCQKEFEKDKADDDVFEKKQKELEAASAVSIFMERQCLSTSSIIK